MGRGPTNENTNMYFQARKKAATYNERLWSREGAAELLGISVSTLADYELGNTKVKVLFIAGFRSKNNGIASERVRCLICYHGTYLSVLRV